MRPPSSLPRFAAALLFAFISGTAVAGAQQYEPLAASVRAALHKAVSDAAAPALPIPDAGERAQWLAEMSRRLQKRIPDASYRTELLTSIHYEATRAGLDPQLVLGLIQVESNFRKYAISSAGARGYMQVMPFWTRLIGDGDPGKLFHMQTNLRFGCVILRHYLDRERGDLFMALGRYNGSRGKPPYPNAVFGAQKKWVFAG